MMVQVKHWLRTAQFNTELELPAADFHQFPLEQTLVLLADFKIKLMLQRLLISNHLLS